jgi:hypothetical protein
MYSMPYAAQALVIPYNIPGITSTLILSTEVTARIFMGNITKWNDPASMWIHASLLPCSSFPCHDCSLPISFYSRSIECWFSIAKCERMFSLLLISLLFKLTIFHLLSGCHLAK